MKTCEAPDCDKEFEPERSTAKFCSATCRQRAGRAKKAAEESVEADEKAGKAEHGLVTAVRKELTEANVLDTVAGQLALQIARQIADPDKTGISGLSKELRSLLAEAKGTSTKPGAGSTDGEPTEPDADVEDEVTKAREARERKARAAAGRT